MDKCPNCGTAFPLRGFVCRSCGADVALWVGREGQVLGPYTAANLRQAYAEGKVGPDDVVMVGNQGQWEPLAVFLEGGPPQPPVPPPAPRPQPPPPPPGGAPGPYYAPYPVAPATGTSSVAVILAVVAAVLVMLALLGGAILFPVFARAREKARQSSCLSNEKQICLALLMYCQDYNETFPHAPTGLPAVPLGRVTPGGLSPTYSGDDWRTVIYPYTKNEQIFLCPTTQSHTSYELNATLYGLRLEQFAQPAQTVSIYEAGFLDNSQPPPHNGGYNVGFVDGHCKWQKDKAGTQMGP